MCLTHYDKIEPGQEEGWCVKEFYIAGGSGSFVHLKTPYKDTSFVLGKTAFDKNANLYNLLIKADYGEYYPAGFHAYKNLCIRIPLTQPSSVMVLCYYRFAVAQDDNVIVAQELTPYLIL